MRAVASRALLHLIWLPIDILEHALARTLITIGTICLATFLINSRTSTAQSMMHAILMQKIDRFADSISKGMTQDDATIITNQKVIQTRLTSVETQIKEIERQHEALYGALKQIQKNTETR